VGTAKAKAQIGMDDRFVHDDELEELLERRQSLKEGVAEYRQADKAGGSRLKIKTADE